MIRDTLPPSSGRPFRIIEHGLSTVERSVPRARIPAGPHEGPPSLARQSRWGSDFMGDVLRALGIEYVAAIPGFYYINNLNWTAPTFIDQGQPGPATRMAGDRAPQLLIGGSMGRSR